MCWGWHLIRIRPGQASVWGHLWTRFITRSNWCRIRWCYSFVCWHVGLCKTIGSRVSNNYISVWYSSYRIRLMLTVKYSFSFFFVVAGYSPSPFKWLCTCYIRFIFAFSSSIYFVRLVIFIRMVVEHINLDAKICGKKFQVKNFIFFFLLKMFSLY